MQGKTPGQEDLAMVPYSKLVLEESMRLFPPVPVLERTAMTDDELGGFRIPRGAVIDLSLHGAHRNPHFWKEPDEFKPERFLGADSSIRQAYFPFGTGPRMCIGSGFAMLEAQILLVRIFQTFRMHPGYEVEPVPEIVVTLRPTSSVLVRLEEIPISDRQSSFDQKSTYPVSQILES